MAKPRRSRATDQPLPSCNFAVIVDGVSVGFCAVSSICVVGGPLSGLDFTPPRNPRELDKLALEQIAQLPTVTLRRGVTRCRKLFQWRQNILGRKSDFRTVEIQLLDEPGGSIVDRWTLRHCWPRRWTGPSLDALCEDVAYEELELYYLRVTWR